MKRQRKTYQTPKRPWDKERIDREKELMKKYGLKNKREIWRTEAMLRKYRRLARELIGKEDKAKEKILIEKLAKFGILQKNATIDDVLSLTIEDFLNRRLQTIVYKKNFANTPKQARQFITHGHVLINNKIIPFPSYMVPLEEEDKIIVKVMPTEKAVKVGTNDRKTE